MNDNDIIRIRKNSVECDIYKMVELKDGRMIPDPDGPHGAAVGIGDHETPEAYQAAVEALVSETLGESIANPVATLARLSGERDQAQQSLAQAEQAKQAAEQAREEALKEKQEVEAAKQAAEAAREEALQSKQQKEQELADEIAAHQADLEKLLELEQRLEEAAELGEVIIGLVESGEDIPEEVIENAKQRINANRVA